MMTMAFRPIEVWPHGSTPAHARRSRHVFRAAWSDTLNLLERELRHLGARNVVIGCGLREQDIRNDGWPRSGARVLEHPGVEVSFDSPHGRLVYATDVCAWWEHNVRAIGLGLEALRAVDRHGITRRGEQYAGFKALTAGGPSPERGATIVGLHGSVRAALRATHPDHGGDPADFADVQAYREISA
jgi:hypothetical protein